MCTCTSGSFVVFHRLSIHQSVCGRWLPSRTLSESYWARDVRILKISLHFTHRKHDLLDVEMMFVEVVDTASHYLQTFSDFVAV